jgi:tRNA-2-methylthio-N6-dimethylallyladenosine synthase
MKYFIQTFGCQQNKADSEYLAGMLEAMGMEEAEALTAADLFLVNTCSVRQAAEDRVYGLANKVAALKEKNPRFRAVVVGCMVGSVRGARRRYEEGELRRRLYWADEFLEASRINSLPRMLLKWGVISPRDARLPGDIKPKRESGANAYVNISTGCDNFCTYCVVPYARGPEVSRPKEEILREVRRAAAQGRTEITLLGQNVNSWGLDRETKFKIRAGSPSPLPFAGLLREVHEVAEVTRIGFLSSNPFDFTLDLIDTLKLPKMDRYLHLPVQSGDDEILARMNRRHTVEEYKKLVATIRDRVSGIEIGTDIIVGFPGETETQFQNTVSLCREVGFSVAYIAKYSPRPGTAAARSFADDVPLEEKRRRFKILDQLVNNKHEDSTR